MVFCRQTDFPKSDMFPHESSTSMARPLGSSRLRPPSRRLGTKGMRWSISLAELGKSELDHRRFLDVAEGSAVKVAAYLDLAVQRRTLCQAECDPGKASGKDRGDAVADVRVSNQRRRIHQGRLTSTKEAIKVATKARSASAEHVQTPGHKSAYGLQPRAVIKSQAISHSGRFTPLRYQHADHPATEAGRSHSRWNEFSRDLAWHLSSKASLFQSSAFVPQMKRFTERRSPRRSALELLKPRA